VAGADSRREGRDPLDARERRALGVDANRIVVAGYSAGGMLSLMAAARTASKEFEGEGGNAGVSSDVNACIGVYPLASAQIATGLFPQGQATPENIAAASPDVVHHARLRADDLRSRHERRHGAGAVEHRLLHQAPRARRAVHVTLIQGADHAFDNARSTRSS
jgi:dienelactone hydrolase